MDNTAAESEVRSPDLGGLGGEGKEGSLGSGKGSRCRWLGEWEGEPM